jgi:hypothetical protein
MILTHKKRGSEAMADDCSDPKQAIAVIREAVEQLLTANQIYKLANHGWVGPDDTDPDEIGHAMWQLDDPADAAIMRSWDKTDPIVLPEWKKLSSVAGADFEGLMNGARLSIGFSLLFTKQIGESLDDEDSIGAMHSRATIMALGAASERIREYFIAGIFRTSPNTYMNSDDKKLQRKRSEYCAPFFEASALAADLIQLSARINALQDMAARIHVFRKDRNVVAHRIATELGRMRLRSIERAAEGTMPGTEWESLTDADIFHIAQHAKKQERTKVDDTVNPPMNWYRLLIEFSESVFFVENHFRRARP